MGLTTTRTVALVSYLLDDAQVVAKELYVLMDIRAVDIHNGCTAFVTLVRKLEFLFFSGIGGVEGLSPTPVSPSPVLWVPVPGAFLVGSLKLFIGFNQFLCIINDFLFFIAELFFLRLANKLLRDVEVFAVSLAGAAEPDKELETELLLTGTHCT